MVRPSPRHRLAVATLLCAGCTPSPAPVDPTAGRHPVVVVLRGSAFNAPGSRDEASRAVAEATGLPVRVIEQEPAMERVTEPAAAGFDRAVARPARQDARDAGCRKKTRSIVTAVTERGAMIVRIRLDARTDTRQRARLDGTVERTTFPDKPSTARQRVQAADRRLGETGDAPPQLRDALARAFAAMPAPRPNRWDTVARTLVAGGCPVLGTAVADTFVDEANARSVRTAAIAALQSTRKARVASSAPPAGETASEVDRAPGTVRVTAVARDGEPTCAALCNLQMIQICNTDRALWDRNGSRWEETRCGTRRSERFLAKCYRMQRESDTYDRACVRPCEDAADGRSRLASMLRRAGCLRDSMEASRPENGTARVGVGG